MKYQDFHNKFVQFCTDNNLGFDGPNKIIKDDGTVTIVYDLNDFTQHFRTISLIVSEQDNIIGISLRGMKLKDVADNINIDGSFFRICLNLFIINCKSAS